MSERIFNYNPVTLRIDTSSDFNSQMRKKALTQIKRTGKN